MDTDDGVLMDDDVAALLNAGVESPRPVPGPTQEQMVAAFESASECGDEPGDEGFERAMVHDMSLEIRWAQLRQHMRRRRVNPPPPRLTNIKQVQIGAKMYVSQVDGSWKMEPAADPKPDPMQELGKALAEAAAAVGSTFASMADALNDAMRPFLDLLDQMEAQPPQPTCPSHAIAMKGGRCPRCERQFDRHRGF